MHPSPVDTHNERADSCDQCGRSISTRPITLKTLFGDALNVLFNFEKGFLFTLKELTMRPAGVISNYLEGRDRHRYYNPFRYAFVIITLSTVIFAWAGYFDDLGRASQTAPADEQLIGIETVKDYSNFFVLPLIPFCSLLTWLFFRRKNLAEHLVINFFFFGHTALLGFPQILIYLLAPSSAIYLSMLSSVVLVSYLMIAYRLVFSRSWIASFLLTVVSLLLGFLLFMTTVALFASGYLFLKGLF